jgi:plastocyanin
MLNPAILGPSANVPQPPASPVLDQTDMLNSGFLPAPGPNPSMDFAMTIGDVTGPIPYLCLLHDASGMTGKLMVVPAS